MSERKVIPIGIEDFKEILDKNCYFVDKTLMIKDIMCNILEDIAFTEILLLSA